MAATMKACKFAEALPICGNWLLYDRKWEVLSRKEDNMQDTATALMEQQGWALHDLARNLETLELFESEGRLSIPDPEEHEYIRQIISLYQERRQNERVGDTN